MDIMNNTDAASAAFLSSEKDMLRIHQQQIQSMNNVMVVDNESITMSPIFFHIKQETYQHSYYYFVNDLMTKANIHNDLNEQNLIKSSMTATANHVCSKLIAILLLGNSKRNNYARYVLDWHTVHKFNHFQPIYADLLQQYSNYQNHSNHSNHSNFNTTTIMSSIPSYGFFSSALNIYLKKCIDSNVAYEHMSHLTDIYPNTFNLVLCYSELEDMFLEQQQQDESYDKPNEERLLDFFSRYNVPEWSTTLLSSWTMPETFQAIEAAHRLQYDSMMTHVAKYIANHMITHDMDENEELFHPSTFGMTEEEYVA